MKTTLPLKFKCWHRLKEKLFEVIQIHDGLPVIVSLPSEVGARTVTYVMTKADEPYLTVVQATGYKDTDSKDIFEGDIITADAGPLKDRIGVIEFFDGSLVVIFTDPAEEGEEGGLLSEVFEEGNIKVLGSALEWLKEEDDGEES